jgi:uncharacterized protein (TIGR03435 family)
MPEVVVRRALAGTMRANGVTLKNLVAIAHDMPPVRVIAPAWLADTRYSINAIAGLDASDSFRSFLHQELQQRMQLKTHVEVRPFDVFVLTAGDAPRLERSAGGKLSMSFGERNVQLLDASMANLASALQTILGKPVIDETGITGVYTMRFGWEDDRLASVTAVLRDRFGLRLSSGTRDMEALIVDGIRRDPALLLLGEVGRLTRAAPPQVRRLIAEALTIR